HVSVRQCARHQQRFEYRDDRIAKIHPTCRDCPAQYFARRIFLSTLPTAVSGRLSTNSTCLGTCVLPLRSFTCCISASAAGCVPGLTTTSAATASPHLSCGTPITAAIATSGWEDST